MEQIHVEFYTISSRDSSTAFKGTTETPPLGREKMDFYGALYRATWKKDFFNTLKKTFLYFFVLFLYFFVLFSTFFVLQKIFLTGSGSSQSQKSNFLKNGLMNIVHTFSIIAGSCLLPFFKFSGKSIVQISRKWGIPQKITVHMQYLGNGWRYDDETW